MALVEAKEIPFFVILAFSWQFMDRDFALFCAILCDAFCVVLWHSFGGGMRGIFVWRFCVL